MGWVCVCVYFGFLIVCGVCLLLWLLCIALFGVVVVGYLFCFLFGWFAGDC